MNFFVKCLLTAGLVAVFAAGCGDDDDSDRTPNDTSSEMDGGTGNDTSDTGTGPDSSGGLLVDDFEDGDTISALGIEWGFFNDNTPDNGASTINYEIVAGYQSTGALSVTFALDQGEFAYDPYVGWSADLQTPPEAPAVPRDISSYTGVSYMHKGAAHSVRLETSAVTDYAYYSVSVPEAADWVLVELPIADFAQPTWGVAVDFNPADVNHLSIQVQGATGTTGNVMMDDIKFYTTM